MVQRVFLATCLFFTLSAVAAKGQVTVAYTANRQGETEPCGCKIKDLGGLARMEKRLLQLRKEGGLIFLDAGNTFFSAPKLHESRKKLEENRAERIAKMYRLTGLKALSPGERDFARGVPFFWELIRKSGATAISANLESSLGSGSFKPFLLWEEQGLRFVVVGLTSFEAINLPAGIKQRDPKESMREVWKNIQKEKPDQAIVLSHLGTKEDEELAKEFPGIWIVGSKSLDFFEEPKKVVNSFLFEVGIEGQRLGEILIEKGRPSWTRAKLTELDEGYDKPRKQK
ncbi:MAG: hypothetical protein EBQ92_05320 [Proteobacteria bacterium]|nr:hypothetical protein [Pseudomonadota bacterium]